MNIIDKIVPKPVEHKSCRVSCFRAMEIELNIYYKAIVRLNDYFKDHEEEPSIDIPINMIYMYVVELGLKMLSYPSHPGFLNSKNQSDFKRESSNLATGIYKVNNDYFNIVQPITHSNKVYPLKRSKEDNITIARITYLIEEKLKCNALSHDELFYIFENYAPYPKTHNFVDIFSSIRPEYKQKVFSYFKSYHIKYLQTLSDTIGQEKATSELTLEDFEKDILKNLPNFATSRYISAGDGRLRVYGSVIGSLVSAIFEVLEKIKNESII